MSSFVNLEVYSFWVYLRFELFVISCTDDWRPNDATVALEPNLFITWFMSSVELKFAVGQTDDFKPSFGIPFSSSICLSIFR